MWLGEPGQRSRPAAAGIRHVDTTRNWAAPKVELALIAIDFNGWPAAGGNCAVPANTELA
ncbi:hypothetical protein C6Q09_18385 [Burkholderia multivorans]|nr:hypothetical protein C6Q09_18385 [Burkholderia multivorans]PRH49681.1 hypothetical protein C6V05_04115 [Burkholderia multivorans]